MSHSSMMMTTLKDVSQLLSYSVHVLSNTSIIFDYSISLIEVYLSHFETTLLYV